MTNSNEIWQVEVNNQIYEATVEELCQWITEGALLPADRVRRGNLRWLEARKVPALHQFFNAQEHGLQNGIRRTVIDNSAESDSILMTENIGNAPTFNQSEFDKSAVNFPATNPLFGSTPINAQLPNTCAVHTDAEPKYVCETCQNYFCKLCPTSYGSSVKVCPLCGAMCRSISDVQAKQQRNFQYQRAATEGFGLSDFGNALAHPFKFKSSLIFGAVLFMILTLGQTAGGVGGIVLGAAGIVCAMLANSLTFACLANTIDNFTQGKTEADFMPNFEVFSLWEDVIHPFFLSVGVYIISFGLLIILLIGAFYYAMQSFTQIENDKEKIVSKIFPNAQKEYTAAKQIPQINQIEKQLNEQNRWKNGELPDEQTIANSQQNATDKEAEFQKLEEMSRQNRKEQLESIAGENPESELGNFNQIARNSLRLSLIFAIPVFLAFLWGAFYFPVACAVAGYTRSFTAVINPMVGLDAIRRLGFNYAKILAMCFVLGILSFALGGILSVVFSPFEMPRVGNLPAAAIGGLFKFYFFVVFSTILGSALYKCSDRLSLYRG